MPNTGLDEKQFASLFDEYYEELCRVVFSIVKDLAAAEDVVQEVFVKIWTRKDELKDISNYKAYLYKSVVLRALDYLRKKKTEGVLKSELKIVHSHIQEAHTGLEQKELRALIEKGLEQMPEQMRLIFHLSRFSSLKNREVASQLNISIKTVESNLSKALKILHEHLERAYKNPTFKTVFWLLTGYLLKV